MSDSVCACLSDFEWWFVFVCVFPLCFFAPLSLSVGLTVRVSHFVWLCLCLCLFLFFPLRAFASLLVLMCLALCVPVSQTFCGSACQCV